MDNMDSLTEFLGLALRPGTFVLGIAIYVATFFTKRVVEILKPAWKPSKGSQQQKSTKEVVNVQRYATTMSMWWNDVILHGIPVLYGMLAGLIQSQFLFGPANEHVMDRVLWACGIGWFSSFLYKAIRRLALQKVGVEIEPSSIAPPPGDGT